MRKLAALGLAALALFVADGADAKSAKKKRASAGALSGTVTMVDPSARTLELRHGKKDGSTTSFQLAADTPVVAGEAPLKLGDLAVGQRVTVTFALEGDARMAKRIEVEPAAQP